MTGSIADKYVDKYWLHFQDYCVNHASPLIFNVMTKESEYVATQSNWIVWK